MAPVTRRSCAKQHKQESQDLLLQCVLGEVCAYLRDILPPLPSYNTDTDMKTPNSEITIINIISIPIANSNKENSKICVNIEPVKSDSPKKPSKTKNGKGRKVVRKPQPKTEGKPKEIPTSRQVLIKKKKDKIPKLQMTRAKRAEIDLRAKRQALLPKYHFQRPEVLDLHEDNQPDFMRTMGLVPPQEVKDYRSNLLKILKSQNLHNDPNCAMQPFNTPHGVK